ncbi:MAG: hypothetical protein RL758_1565 [Pseudomonadota bacterium]|jgi:hypothetical protein
MNRCTPSVSPRVRIKLLAALLTGLGLCTATAQAQTLIRRFPDPALRGTFQVVLWPDVLVDGKPERMSPGARVYNQMNSSVLSSQLPAGTYLVNYTREIHGMIHQVWILTEAEAAEKRKTAGGTPTFSITISN